MANEIATTDRWRIMITRPEGTTAHVDLLTESCARVVKEYLEREGAKVTIVKVCADEQ